jgi:hypothetical protein
MGYAVPRRSSPPCEGPLRFAISAGVVSTTSGFIATLIAMSCFGCAGANANGQAAWPETAKKWFDRADAS